MTGACPEAAASLPDTCNIVGWLTVPNARGRAVNRTEDVRLTGIPCRIERFDVLVFGTEGGGAYGRQGETVDVSTQAYQCALPWGTDVRQSDHLILSGGGRFEVSGIDTDTSDDAFTTARLVKLGVDNPQEG
jgi:hypothetical protein